ncbi:hypothetical protein [Camelimonas lactis]|uniref:hypothetical protein n=1 Tax=Camelimonas lactis TaxID=659006 RepID=UPI00104D99D2|nr:hypothetical protein [Camelimonas lactis]
MYDFSGAFRNLNSALSGLGDSFEAAALKKQRAGIGEDALAGNFSGAAAKAFKAGDFDSGLKLLGMGREQADNAAADKSMSLMLGGAPLQTTQFGDGTLGGIGRLGAGAPAGQNGGGGTLADLGRYNQNGNLPSFARIGGSPDALRTGIIETAKAIGADPVDLATAISFETAGTFDPTKAGPKTKWGQHRGLIQFGEPQAQEYGVDWNNPLGSQLGANGAVAKYLTARGFRPGMSGLDLYSTINAGSPGRYAASDTAAGGTPGDVRDKWTNQMADHRANAQRLIGDVAQQPTQVAQAQTGATTPDQARAGIARIDSLLNDQELTPQQRQSLEQRRERYVQVAQGGQQGQPQADMPAQGAMEAQQAFQIPGTGQVVPAGTRITPRAMAAMKVMNSSASASRKEVAKMVLQEELKNANPVTQLDIEGKRLSNEKARRDLARGETTANITEYNYAREQGYTGSFDKFLADKAQKTTVDMRGESEEAKAIGQAAGKRAGETMSAASLGVKQLQRIGRMEVLMEQVETGKMAPARMNLGAWGKALGVNDDFLNSMGLDPKKVGDAQALNAIAGRMVIDMIGAGGFPANNFSDADRQFITGTVPQLANDPRGNKLIMEAARRTAQMDIEKAKAWRQWKHTNKSGSFDDFEMLWADQVGSKNHFADLAEQAAAITGARPGAQQGQQQQGQQGQQRQPAALGPSPEAVQHLRSNPQFRDQFDARYGAGAAARAMGGR